MKTRYTHCGDDQVFAQMSDSMSLEVFFKGLSIKNKIKEMQIQGFKEVILGNMTFLVRFCPSTIHPLKVVDIIKEVEKSIEDADPTFNTRIIEFPVFYKDPWTHSYLMQFRDNHPDPGKTDLQYSAEMNNFDNENDFIKTHHSSPWCVTMLGFSPSMPFMYQMVERDSQLQVPKYIHSRPNTPALTVGFGGSFTSVYSVPSLGSHQMLGITPVKIFNPEQKINYFQHSIAFFRLGDVVCFQPIDRREYDLITRLVAKGQYHPKIQEVVFSLDEFNKDMNEYNRKLKEAIYVN